MMRTRLPLLLGLFVASLSLACDSGRDAEVPSAVADSAPAQPEPTLTAMRLEVRPVLRSLELDPVVARVNGVELRASKINAHLTRVEPQHVEQRREVVVRRLVDEMLLDQWLDEHAPTHVRHLARRDAQLAAKFGDEEAFARHCTDTQVSDEAVRADLLRAVRLQEALAPQPTEEAVSRLYTRVTRRPAVRTMYDLYSVAPNPRLDAEQLCANTGDLRQFRRISGRHQHLGSVATTALSSTLADKLAGGERCVAVGTPSGVQLYWVEEVQRVPTQPFALVAPKLKERETTRMLAQRRIELLNQLRETATIEMVSAPATANVR